MKQKVQQMKTRTRNKTIRLMGYALLNLSANIKNFFQSIQQTLAQLKQRNL